MRVFKAEMMDTQAAKFAANLKRMADSFTDVSKFVVIKGGTDLETAIRIDTPKDTGKAQAGWQNNGAHFEFGRTFSIWNLVEYIEDLENGHSDQAPTGMMAKNLVRANSMFRKYWRQAGME